MRVAKLFLATIFVSFLIPSGLFASSNLLQNPDFEESGDGSFSSWQKTPSTLTLSTASGGDQTHNGNFAAKFKSQTNSTKYLYQVVSSPSGTYKLSAWLKLLTGNQSGFVRLSWYESGDGSGSEMAKVDSQPVSVISDWQRIEVIGETPVGANSIRAKLVLDPSSSELSELLFDEVLLETVAASPGLSFSVSLPESVDTGEEFGLNINLTGLSGGSSYFLKLLGDEKTKLTGELYNFYTFSPSKKSFLAWNAAWSDFPSFVTDSSGSASVPVTGKFKTDSFLGENKIVVRLRKEGSQSNIDSNAVPINVNQPEAPVTEVDDGKKEPPTPGPFLDSSSQTTFERVVLGDELASASVSPDSSESGMVLAASSSAPSITLLNHVTPEGKPGEDASPGEFPWEIPLIASGGLIFVGALLTAVVKGGGWGFLRGLFFVE